MTREAIADGLDRIARALEESTTVNHTLAEILEELRQDLVHALRNHGAEWIPERTNETICCDSCSVDSLPSLAAAIHTGWIDINVHDGETEFIGHCPGCIAKDDERDEELNAPHIARERYQRAQAEVLAESQTKSKTLFDLSSDNA